jgi:cytochrome c-type biogenesis protein CcmF
LLLTAVGPLLAWRKTSVDSLKRNFLWPACGALVVGVLMIAFGGASWNDVAYLYALMTAMLAALVMLTVLLSLCAGPV